MAQRDAVPKKKSLLLIRNQMCVKWGDPSLKQLCYLRFGCLIQTEQRGVGGGREQERQAEMGQDCESPWS